MPCPQLVAQFSCARLFGLWTISGHNRTGRRLSDVAIRVILTSARFLDMHGRVVMSPGTACVLRANSRRALRAWVALTLVAMVAMTSPILALDVASGLLAGIGTTSAISAYRTKREVDRFDEPVSHILADLVRSQRAERGSGAELTRFVLDLSRNNEWVLGGEAANESLVRRFYEPLGFVEVNPTQHLILA